MAVVLARTDLSIVGANRPTEACKGIGSRERKAAVLGKAVEKAKKASQPAPKQP